MILLQILAFLLFFPMTLILFFLFYIYALNWKGFAIITAFGVMYSLVFGLIFLNMNVAIFIFLILAISYLFRLKCLSNKIRRDTTYPNVWLQIKNKKEKIKINFILQLSLLKIIKWLPAVISKQISEKLNLHITLPELVELFLKDSSGTKIEIVTEDVSVYFEIK